MRKFTQLCSALLLSLLATGSAKAQLSTNPDKFLGNITTSYQVDYGGYSFYKYWNQLTCENESKWGSVEGTNGRFNWPTNQSNYCTQHKFPFKWHALIWGAQHPSWFNSSMSPEQRYKEIVEWMDAIKKQYPNLEIIDVANECISGHQADTYLFAEALGGGGATGWDWLAKAFELAYERWPNAVLIYNDFNTFQWNTDQFIEICQTLRDAGAPIDAYGCQSHDLTDCNLSKFKESMNKLQTTLKMPMYSTEYDIGTSDDALQLQRYKEQIPVMWESDYCAGITLWGWHYGHTWTTDGNSGIIRNGQNRPAMDWLIEYMKSDNAKNAKSPFPGMKKEASVYIKPQAANIEKDIESIINVRASMRTKTIEKVELYEGTKLIGTMTEPTSKGVYGFAYKPTVTGKKSLKAVVTCTDGYTWERVGAVTVCNARAPFKNTVVAVPGKLEFENFDSGADGIAFHDLNANKQGDAASYRTDVTGIDVGNGGTGKVVGYTEAGEWMEYTIDVKETGLYNYDIHYATPTSGVKVNLQLSTADGQVKLTEDIPMARTSTSNSWSTFKDAHGRLLLPLTEGRNIIRFNLVGGDSQYLVNLDYIRFTRVDVNEDIKVTLASDPKVTSVSSKTTIAAEVTGSEDIKNVTFYVDGVKSKSVTEAPYQIEYTPTLKGNVQITAVATDNSDKESKIASYDLKVTAKRTPYKTNKVPGVIQAEDFDKGEEGFTYHDSDAEYHDKPSKLYRSDSEGVDIVEGNGGYVIGWTAANEWLEYTIEVADSAYYTCDLTYSNGSSTAANVVVTSVDAATGKQTTLWSFSSCAGTGAWGTYKDKKMTARKILAPGKQIIRITFKNGNINLDSFKLNCVEVLVPTAIQEVSADESVQSSDALYNLQGQKVDGSYRGIVIKNGKKIWQK